MKTLVFRFEDHRVSENGVLGMFVLCGSIWDAKDFYFDLEFDYKRVYHDRCCLILLSFYIWRLFLPVTCMMKICLSGFEEDVLWGSLLLSCIWRMITLARNGECLIECLKEIVFFFLECHDWWLKIDHWYLIIIPFELWKL